MKKRFFDICAIKELTFPTEGSIPISVSNGIELLMPPDLARRIGTDGIEYLSSAQVVDALKSRIAKHGDQARLSREIGIPQQALNNVLQGRDEPTGKILDFVGCRKVIRYKKMHKVG